MKEKNWIKGRITSFKYAFNGLKTFIIAEQNARIHFAVSLIVIILGFTFKITSTEWLFICLSIGLVITAETINTAIEKLADFISPQQNQSIKIVKDLAAFAVLFSVIISVVVGIIIFSPKILEML